MKGSMNNTLLAMSLALVACTSEGVLESLEMDPPSVRPLEPPAATHVDRFSVVLSDMPLADVLLVLTESEPPGVDLNYWRTELAVDLMNTLHDSSINYRIGVVQSTQSVAGQGVLEESNGHAWVSRGIPNRAGVLRSLVAGAANSHPHQGFDNIYTCLKPDGRCRQRDFRRDAASIHAIVLETRGQLDSRLTRLGLQRFLDFYNGLTPNPEDRTLSSIVDLSDAPGYVTATSQVGGVLLDVFDPDYEPLLDLFRVDVVQNAERDEYFLSRWPVVDTLTLEVLQDGSMVPPPVEEDWQYDAQRNAVIVDVAALPEGEFELRVGYEVRSGIGRP